MTLIANFEYREKKNFVEQIIEVLIKSPLKFGLNLGIFICLVCILVPPIHNAVEGIYTANNFLNRVKAWIPSFGLSSALPKASQVQYKGLTKAQSQNANAIINQGRAMKMSDRDIQIALMTAFQESSMINQKGGDDWHFQAMGWGEKSDSRGLFQQRDSWGSQQCRLNPSCSSKLFYQALLKVENRNNLQEWEVAAKVQRPAKQYERHYDQWKAQSKSILKDSGNLKVSDSIKLPNFNPFEIFNNKPENPSQAVKLDDNFKKVPQKGDTLAGYSITSGWGKRDTGIAGASTFHQGIDAGTPEGTPVYMIGTKENSEVTVKCWTDNNGGGNVATFKTEGYQFDYLHLKSCNSGRYKPGQQIGETGSTGVGEAHFHFQQRKLGEDREPPYWGYMEQSLKPR